MDRCFQEMLDEEDQDWFIPSRDLPQAMGQLQQQLNGLSVSDGHDSEDILVRAISSSTCDIVRRIWIWSHRLIFWPYYLGQVSGAL